MNEVRINKLLSERGICSRRAADRLISEGKVRVNDVIAVPGQMVTDSDIVLIDGIPLELSAAAKPEPVVIAFNKPRGIVCTDSDKDRAPNIIDCIGYKDRLFTIGRLDKDSEGLILLTNRGELVNLINKSRFEHEKEYVVRCSEELTEEFLKKMSDGVKISVPVSKNNAIRLIRTKPASVRKIDAYTFDIILTQGLNRQIRRMCLALGNKVERLKRIRVMNIKLGLLKTGTYRIISGKELRELETLAGINN